MLYHIDTDMGVDDALALVLAQRMLLDVVRVTTVAGNIPVCVATRNALLLRELLGCISAWTVLQGADRAMSGYQADASHIHGIDGLAGATAILPKGQVDAAGQAGVPLFSTQPSPRHGQDVTLVVLGPATNVPDLVVWYGRSSVRRIVMMGGVFRDRGNVTPWAEFNSYADPEALQATLALGIPTLIVPLDVTQKVQIIPRVIFESQNSAESDLVRVMRASHERYSFACKATEGIEGFFPHDALAVLAAAYPARFYTVRGRVEVALSGDQRGLTSLSEDENSHIEVATGGDLRWARTTLTETFAQRSLKESVGNRTDADGQDESS